MDERLAFIIKIAVIVLGMALLISLVKTVLPIAIGIAAGLFIYKFITETVKKKKYRGE